MLNVWLLKRTALTTASIISIFSASYLGHQFVYKKFLFSILDSTSIQNEEHRLEINADILSVSSLKAEEEIKAKQLKQAIHERGLLDSLLVEEKIKKGLTEETIKAITAEIAKSTKSLENENNAINIARQNYLDDQEKKIQLTSEADKTTLLIEEKTAKLAAIVTIESQHNELVKTTENSKAPATSAKSEKQELVERQNSIIANIKVSVGEQEVNEASAKKTSDEATLAFTTASILNDRQTNAVTKALEDKKDKQIEMRRLQEEKTLKEEIKKTKEAAFELAIAAEAKGHQTCIKAVNLISPTTTTTTCKLKENIVPAVERLLVPYKRLSALLDRASEAVVDIKREIKILEGELAAATKVKGELTKLWEEEKAKALLTVKEADSAEKLKNNTKQLLTKSKLETKKIKEAHQAQVILLTPLKQDVVKADNAYEVIVKQLEVLALKTEKIAKDKALAQSDVDQIKEIQKNEVQVFQALLTKIGSYPSGIDKNSTKLADKQLEINAQKNLLSANKLELASIKEAIKKVDRHIEVSAINIGNLTLEIKNIKEKVSTESAHIPRW